MAHLAVERAHELDIEVSSDRKTAAQSTEEERVPLSEERRRLNCVLSSVAEGRRGYGYEHGEGLPLTWWLGSAA